MVLRYMAGLVVMSLLVASVATGVGPHEIHVAMTGHDRASGTAQRPYRTISRAAEVAQPGDTVLVHAGTYREHVRPPRGGRSEEERIVYKAAPGETVVIKGSERIQTWAYQDYGVWKVELPFEFFGDRNPFYDKISGPFLFYGANHHCGCVYYNGDALTEVHSVDEVVKNRLTWYADVHNDKTTIWANFRTKNPNHELVEINVRDRLFFPNLPGLGYITIDGFHMMHCADNWRPTASAPGVQPGAVGPRMGAHWVVQNCTISDARCVGLVLGGAPDIDASDIDSFGGHIIRNNHIRRCGQAGIAGSKGLTRCILHGNLIEDINYRREFGGAETAGIKFHNAVDTVVSNNLIRRVRHQGEEAFCYDGPDRKRGYGLWVDWANQGIRISGNVIYDTDEACMFIEMNHGPILIDNNVFVGKPIRHNSAAVVLAHNLFLDSGYVNYWKETHTPYYYQPHTTKVARSLGLPYAKEVGIGQAAPGSPFTAIDYKWFNNIFIGQGRDMVPEAPGYESDYNVFLAGAKPTTFGDKHSLLDPAPVAFDLEENGQGVKIAFDVPETAAELSAPKVSAERVGTFKTVGQMIEDRHGNPIAVDTDIRGNRRVKVVPGPLAELASGSNTIQWSFVASDEWEGSSPEPESEPTRVSLSIGNRPLSTGKHDGREQL